MALFIFAIYSIKKRDRLHLKRVKLMKYTRLTKQQLEELHQEFINFLATQSITGDEWESIKSNTPKVAEEEIDVFSDLVWEGVLSKVDYVENISSQQMHLFHLTDKEMKLISVKVMNPEIDLTTDIGFNWFRKNWQSDFVEYLTASKAYTEDKNLDKFKLIQQGAVITKGELYQWFEKVILE
tara:strand:+ start:86361 stop:86906 length:546 start_codon:yes stop_codon:yes gene_type:complete